MSQRRWAVLLTAALCLGLLAGCGEEKPPGDAETTPEVVEASTKLNRPPQPEQILSDVNRSKDVELPPDGFFTACEVIKRQSNPEDKEDVVFCRLTAEVGYLRAQRQYKLLYNFYDEGGWILDEATPENEDEWTEDYLDGNGNSIMEGMVWLNQTYDEGRGGAGDYLIVRRGDLWGYLDKSTGEEIVPCNLR